MKISNHVLSLLDHLGAIVTIAIVLSVQRIAFPNSGDVTTMATVVITYFVYWTLIHRVFGTPVKPSTSSR